MIFPTRKVRCVECFTNKHRNSVRKYEVNYAVTSTC
jgi:hypothetical protein